jgi:hypothetical protein
MLSYSLAEHDVTKSDFMKNGGWPEDDASMMKSSVFGFPGNKKAASHNFNIIPETSASFFHQQLHQSGLPASTISSQNCNNSKRQQ